MTAEVDKTATQLSSVPLPAHVQLSLFLNSIKTNLQLRGRNAREFAFVLFLRRFVALLRRNDCDVAELWVTSERAGAVACRFGFMRELFVFGGTHEAARTRLPEQLELLTASVF